MPQNLASLDLLEGRVGLEVAETEARQARTKDKTHNIGALIITYTIFRGRNNYLY